MKSMFTRKAVILHTLPPLEVELPDNVTMVVITISRSLW